MAEVSTRPTSSVGVVEDTAAETSVGRPQEQLELDTNVANEEGIIFPKGSKLWSTMVSLLIATFLNGLDLTVVAVAVPSLTDEFKTIADIGWYNAAYGLTLSSFVFFFGKAYTVFTTKQVYMFGLITFELGSLVCTFANSSALLIFGRALTGLGSSAVNAGILKLLRHCFPMSKQPMMIGLVGAAQAVGLVAAPAIGGVLIDAFGWRACFGINLPLGVICIILSAWAYKDPIANSDIGLSWKEKIKRLNIHETLLAVPSITCLLMALQWGGGKYQWNNWRIILLLVLFAVLISAFGYSQHRGGEKATIPLRILKQRSILGAMWYTACCNAILATVEYYTSIYLQGVRGLSPTRSGLLGLPLIAGLAVASLLGAVGTTAVGYYHPVMIMTNILAPIAAGLLTTLEVDSVWAKPAALLGFLGAAVGLSIQAPMVAVQALLPLNDITIGSAVLVFGAGMGSAFWVSVSATLFQNRLADEVGKLPLVGNETHTGPVGLSEIRNVIGSDRLQEALSGYNEAVVQTLYMPLALTILTLVGTLAIEMRSVKKKQA